MEESKEEGRSSSHCLYNPSSLLVASPGSLSGAKPHPRVFLAPPGRREEREIASSDLHGQRELLQMGFITFILKQQQEKQTLNHPLDKE